MSRTCLACFLLLTTVCTCEGGGMAVRTWRRVSVDSRVYTIQTYSRLVTAQSRIACADLCSQIIACHVFYFRSDTGHCFLSPTLGRNNSTTSTPLTHVYFDGVTCPFNNTYQVFSFTSCMKLYTTPVHNSSAYEACLAEGASVVMMKTMEKSTLLMNVAYKVYKATGSFPTIWLAANDLVQENRWVWSDGDTFDPTHPLWQPGKPQLTKHGLIAVYDLLNNIYMYANVWDTRISPYVCEILLI